MLKLAPLMSQTGLINAEIKRTRGIPYCQCLHWFSINSLIRRLLLPYLFLQLFFGCVNAYAEPLLNGLAAHSELGKEQFIGALYLTNPSGNADDILQSNEPKRIQVRITTNTFSARRFKRMWIDGMAINAGPKELAAQSKNMAKFSNLLGVRLIKGDIFTMDRNTDDMVVSLNGEILGVIDDPNLFDLLIRTWIGRVPLSSEFRDKLLSNGNIDFNVLAKFESTTPTESRILAVAEGLETKRGNRLKLSSEVSGSSTANTNAITTTKKSDARPAAPPFKTITKLELPEHTDSATAPDEKEEIITTPKLTVTKVEEEKVVLPPAKVESIFEEEDESQEFTAATLLEQQLYVARLKKWSQKHLRYPKRAVQKGQEGNVRLEIDIDRKGRVTKVSTLEESTHNLLNKEAREAVMRASPFPPMPESVKGQSFTFSLPIAFKLASK